MNKRIIVHIDMDAFFAAIEERDKPRLKGLPIVVGADPNSPAGEGKGRGVVSTANYKAREYGIRSALPISKAWQYSEAAHKRGKPRAVFIGGNFVTYGEVSRSIMEYVREKAEKVQVASVDEAYLEIQNQISKTKDQNQRYGYAEEFAKEIKKGIWEKEKLTCSIGIGPNKLIAKIASDVEKPDGLTIVRPEDVQDFLDPMPVSVIPGIGPKAQEKLRRMRVLKIKDLRGISKEELQKSFGKWGEGMWRRARGISESPIIEEREVKSIGEQRTFLEDTLDANLLIPKLKAISRDVHRRLLQKKFLFRTVTLTVRFHDFSTMNRSRTFKSATDNLSILETEALQIFLPFLDKRENPKKKRIRLLGVRVEKLTENERVTK